MSIKDVHKENGYGFICDDGHIAMERCFKCGRENWAMVVYKGVCAWCGFDANGEVNNES